MHPAQVAKDISTSSDLHWNFQYSVPHDEGEKVVVLSETRWEVCSQVCNFCTWISMEESTDYTRCGQDEHWNVQLGYSTSCLLPTCAWSSSDHLTIGTGRARLIKRRVSRRHLLFPRRILDERQDWEVRETATFKWKFSTFSSLDCLLRAGVSSAEHVVVVKETAVIAEEHTADCNTIITVQKIHRYFIHTQELLQNCSLKDVSATPNDYRTDPCYEHAICSVQPEQCLLVGAIKVWKERTETRISHAVHVPFAFCTRRSVQCKHAG